MEITLEQLNSLDKSQYVLLDMRSSSDRAYGFIPGSIAVNADELIKNPPAFDKKAVIYCAHGVFSVDVAEALCEQASIPFSQSASAWTLPKRFAKRE